jgi:polar amino acid transport system permease protein
MMPQIDLAGVFSGEPAHWLVSGFVVTLVVSALAAIWASVVAIALVGFNLSAFQPLVLSARAFVGFFRNTPLLVQLLFWYFVGYGSLPQAFKFWLTTDRPWSVLPGNISIFSPELMTSAWGLGLFIGAFLAEEIRAGLNAVPDGQQEAAASQGFSFWDTLVSILLPQALANSFQPVVGQYLNLMKLSSLACSIGLAEITYQVRQIESYNSHALEAFAVGTMLYLALGIALERCFRVFQPQHVNSRAVTEGIQNDA